MPGTRRSRQSDDDVITLGRFARAMGISRTTAYVQARAGELPVRWRGGRFEMRARDFRRLLQEKDLAERAQRAPDAA